MEKIEGKADSAAVVVHKLLRSPKPEQLYLKYAHDILGGVALLGVFQNHKLSRGWSLGDIILLSAQYDSSLESREQLYMSSVWKDVASRTRDSRKIEDNRRLEAGT
uniref:Uncharacterized protein n=1 Tax=Solanum lycopersicum TaxID=4081 RepID=A0A3Q7FN05_SOLLC